MPLQLLLGVGLVLLQEISPANELIAPQYASTPHLLIAESKPKQIAQASQKIQGVTNTPDRLNLPQWQRFPIGATNSITDVPGIKVGQISYRQDTPYKIRTGVTAIVPDASALTNGTGNLATTGFKASVVTLNGNGELTGASFINEFGVLNSPILLTNTKAVGTIHEGVYRYFDKYFVGEWSGQLPVIGECYDGFFNNIDKPVITPLDAEKAILSANSGPVEQGQTGAGTGMRSFGLHAGIGSSSRKITLDGKTYTIGILVNMNHSRLEDLNPVIRQQLETKLGNLDQLKTKDDLDNAHLTPPNSPRQGSIQVIIATDLPLTNKQLEEMAKRAGIGIGNTGSPIATTSGDFVTAFTTANPIPMGNSVPNILNTSELHPDKMTPIFKATIEAVTEAQINALMASHS